MLLVGVSSFLGWFSIPILLSIAVTVGQNADPVSPVRGVNTASRNNKRLCFVTEGFQIRKHLVECQIDDSRHILTNDPSGLDFLNNSQHFRPEVTVISLAFSFPGEGKRLARESS